MKTKPKLIISLLAILTVSLMLLAGCGASSPAGGQSGTATSPAVPVPPGGAALTMTVNFPKHPAGGGLMGLVSLNTNKLEIRVSNGPVYNPASVIASTTITAPPGGGAATGTLIVASAPSNVVSIDIVSKDILGNWLGEVQEVNRVIVVGGSTAITTTLVETGQGIDLVALNFPVLSRPVVYSPDGTSYTIRKVFIKSYKNAAGTVSYNMAAESDMASGAATSVVTADSLSGGAVPVIRTTPVASNGVVSGTITFVNNGSTIGKEYNFALNFGALNNIPTLVITQLAGGLPAPAPQNTVITQQWANNVGPTPVAAAGTKWVDHFPYYKMVAHGTNIYVAVSLGKIYTSTDGTNWTDLNVAIPPNSGLSNVTWGGGQFVVVGYTNNGITGSPGLVMTSPDGITWTVQATPAGSNRINSVAWGGGPGQGKFVAVGDSSIMTSPDGITWTKQFSGTIARLSGVVWNGPGQGQFVVVGQQGVILTSPDGITWTTRVSGTAGWIMSITWGGPGPGQPGQYVAAGSGVILTSPDGITWTVTPSAGNSFYAVTWGGPGPGQYVVAGLAQNPLTATMTGIVMTSPDGITWTTCLSNSAITFYGAAWDAATGRFILAGFGGILYSTDGITWTGNLPPVNFSNSQLKDVVWSGSQYVAVGTRGAICTSPDGITWTGQVSGTGSDLNSVIWTGGLYVAVGTGGTILTSPDGIAWTIRPTPVTGLGVGVGPLSDISWNGAVYVAVGGMNLTSLTSLDGITWTKNVTGPINLTSIILVGGKFVAVGTFSVFTSLDGVTWTQSSPPGVTGWLNSIAWSGGQYVVTGYNYAAPDPIFTSPDGIVWTPRLSGTVGMGFSSNVIWDGQRFVMVMGGNGSIMASPDGITWTTLFSNPTTGISNIVSGGGKYVVVGGTILTSP